MRDLRVVSAQVLLDIVSVSPMRDFLPPSVLVQGTNLDKASEVYFNDIRVPEMFKSSPTTLIARIPDSQVGREFSSIRAYADVPLVNRAAVLSLALGSSLKDVTGMDRLVQAWILVFMTTRGSDAFDPASGGGGAAIIGRNAGRHGSGAASDLLLAIDRTNAELRRTQARNSGIPLEEKLLSAALASYSFDEADSALNAQVVIKNMTGRSADVSMG